MRDFDEITPIQFNDDETTRPRFKCSRMNVFLRVFLVIQPHVLYVFFIVTVYISNVNIAPGSEAKVAAGVYINNTED